MATSDLSERFGPNWQVVADYISSVPHGFLFLNLGQPHAKDADVLRVRSWDELRQYVYYNFDDAGPETCAYLRFISLCRDVDSFHEDLATKHGLGKALENACTEAADAYVYEGVGENPDWLEFVDQTAYARPYPYCSNSPQDHCTYIATALVVEHLAEHRLLQDMWSWYKAGHWPCGWEGDWPDGRLIVF